MRESLAPILRCPACGAGGDWTLEEASRDAREVRTGALRCNRCGGERAIEHGIVDMLHDPPEFVVREAAGLARFADEMRNDGWTREKVLRLPHLDYGYWYAQAIGMEQILEDPQTAPYLTPGARILDVGSNTCWASATFAERGLDVIALDIAEHEMQGLRTADWWFEDKGLYFERVLGVMFDLPFADDSLDLVFCCEVLHHNHRANLHATFREFHRVLKPGGRIIVINEPVRGLRSPKLDPGKDVEQYEGHEHAYVRPSYRHAAHRAGFRTRLLRQRTIPIFNDGPWTIQPDTPTTLGLRMAAAHAVRRSRRLGGAMLAWRHWVDGQSLYMVATKRG